MALVPTRRQQSRVAKTCLKLFAGFDWNYLTSTRLTGRAPPVSVAQTNLMRRAEVKSPVNLSLWLLLGIVSALVAILTAVIPSWLETFFGFDPDGGNGSAELLMVSASVSVSVLSWLRVAMRIRLAR
jgi:hypothetical protein